MPTPSIHRTATAGIAMLLAAASLFVLPASAAAPARQLAQASSPSTTQSAKDPTMRRSAAEFVEARIKSLHDQLKITKAEEPQWSAVAAAMRDSAESVAALIAERNKTAKTMNAIENLRSYEAIAKAHLDGIQKLLPAFEALYAVMPEAQKKLADTVFSRRPTRPTPRKSG